MAFCTKCGTQLADDAHFCGKCGTPTGTAAKAAPSKVVENLTGGGATQRVENLTFSSFTRLDDTVQASGEMASGFVLAPGQTIVLNGKNCTIEKLIKISGEAEVYTITADGKPLILNYYKPYSPLSDTSKEVITVIKNSPHDRIIRIIDFGSYNDRDYELMEFAEGGTLGDYLEKTGAIRNVNQFKNIVRMINEGLQQLHGKYNIIHGYLKPDNVFFKDAETPQIVLSNFYMSNVMETGDKKAQVVGNLPYLYGSPELVPKTGQKYVIATPAVDYYSLGITILEMWLGEIPFKNMSSVERDFMITEGNVDLPADMPDDCKTLIRGLLKYNRNERWGDKQVQQWLEGQPLQDDVQTWISKGGKACTSPQEIALALEAESTYYMEDLKNPNASLYQYLKAVAGTQGVEASEVFLKYFSAYPPEKALELVCSMLKDN
jgi:serine/threonine protein kinase